ncbi:shikimate dehydrogenase family protein [Plantactinospora soyae]|uniref:Shikimate 5-dehydrogenase n=1 Tax=Plantactinospora soyae TaxID=1544732 RepID=A0A927M046_9ACTN|nr:shikimate dehydrogenase [Plantactinospora soyae]MBE1484445.1 shikimate 5-dehydrogenase [Plantactinospora soyae]
MSGRHRRLEAGETVDRANYMGFVGVTTGSSSINQVFPSWAEILGLPTQRLVGHDLPLDADDEQYRDLVRQIRDDPAHLGALVTTHKLRLYQAAHDLFDEVDDFARLCGEISSIAKRDGKLLGHAKDPLTAGLAAEEFLPDDHFTATGAEVVCLGAGGAGTALVWYLSQRKDRPRRIVCTDTDPDRLAHLRAVAQRGGVSAELVEYVPAADPRAVLDLLHTAPDWSLVVNATGLGKDRPGSPLPPGARLPRQGYVWEFNYRGSLEFLHQARAQADERGLTVVDGWRYFIHGWSQAIAEIFDVPMDPATVQRLSAAAEAVR